MTERDPPSQRETGTGSETGPRSESLRPDSGIAGVVVAGGRSDRFADGEKALARLNGRPLVAHVVDAVAPVVDEVVVNCRADQRDALADALEGSAFGAPDAPEYRFAVDAVAGGGPVAGLRTGLRETVAAYAVTVPCDMPFLESAFLATLLSRAGDGTGAVAEFDGRVEPFPAAVHVRSATAAANEALEAGVGSLRDYLSSLAPTVIPEAETRAHVGPSCFFDVDTRADLRRAQRPTVPPEEGE